MKKRRNLFLVTVVLAICTLSQVTMASWTPYFGESTQPARVDVNYNSSGQTVYMVYDAWGTLVMDLRARNGNIWNETRKVLYTQTNKGPEYVTITPELEVYGLTSESHGNAINFYSNPVKYRNGFLSGEFPYVNSEIKATGFVTNPYGFGIGIKTVNGIYEINTGKYTLNSNNNIIFDNNNYDYNSYPRVTQQGNEYYYYYKSNKHYTYSHSSNNGRLELEDTGSKISSISEINFTPGYLIAVTSVGKVKQIEIGSLVEIKTFDDKFYDWRYYTDKNGNNWVRGYVDIDGEVHYFDIDDDYWYDDVYDDFDEDDYWYNDYNGEYPIFYQSGTNDYIYCVSSTKKYEYTLSSSGKLSHKNKTIASNVIQVWFTRGYITFVEYDEYDEKSTCYKAKLGSTTKTKVCSNFVDFEYDSDGFAIEAISENGKSYDF